MSSAEVKKSKKEKREGNVAYQSIGSSRTSVDTSHMISNNYDKPSSNFNDVILNTPVNLKKSKTFKLIVKKGKDKDKVSFSKKEKHKSKEKIRIPKDLEPPNADIEKAKEMEIKRPLFGVTLKDSCRNSKSHDGYPLPAFFRICVNYLEKDNRLSFEGIYRIPGVNSQVSKLKQALHQNSDTQALLANYDTAVIASIIKAFLRDMSKILLEKRVEKLLFSALEQFKDSVQERTNVARSILNREVPTENLYMLAFIVSHMSKIIDMSHLNKMSLENLIIVLCPTLKLHFELLRFLYDHSSQLFQQWQVPVYVPPIRPGPQHEEELPETVDGINEELAKQISYLDDLHAQISEGIGTDQTENLIWEVQLIVTRLKRKKHIVELTDPDQIKLEIRKYERQLEKLHREMLVAKGADDGTTIPSAAPTAALAVTSNASGSSSVNEQPLNSSTAANVDQELWQVQRTLTTLNRKLKTMSSHHHQQQQRAAHRISVDILDDQQQQLTTVDMTASTTATNNEDDDNDSVQLNLTLRKLPPEFIDSAEEEDGNENIAAAPVCDSGDMFAAGAPSNFSPTNFPAPDVIDNAAPQPELSYSEDSTSHNVTSQLPPVPSISSEILIPPLQTQSDYVSDFAMDSVTAKPDNTAADSSPDVDQHDNQSHHQQQPQLQRLQYASSPNSGICQMRLQPTPSTTDRVTEDELGSNSGSVQTGSQAATCIDHLIQTGEMWTNENEQLLPEDEDLRNEALRLLYMREELISIKNDLKTRLSSESNEILRLKRNIEQLEEEKTQKNFLLQNQYSKLKEDSLLPTKSDEEDVAEEDEDDEEGEDEEDDISNSSSSGENGEEDNNELNSDGGAVEEVSEEVPEVGSCGSNSSATRATGVDAGTRVLLRQREEMVVDNARLERDNDELLEHIQEERERCLELKVALRSQMLASSSVAGCPSPWPANY